MGFYADHVLPRLIDLTMRHEDLAAYRQPLVAGADGLVLEIGVGSGLNLPHYRAGVSEIIGLDPSPRLLAMAREKGASLRLPLLLLQASAEAVPLAEASIDTVVMSWTLCSVQSTKRTLAEIRRVMKPDGELLFVEHGRAPDTSIATWQERLTPVWKCIAGGCHLNRDVPQIVEDAGFSITDLRRAYMPNAPRLFGFMYEGRARKR